MYVMLCVGFVFLGMLFIEVLLVYCNVVLLLLVIVVVLVGFGMLIF